VTGLVLPGEPGPPLSWQPDLLNGFEQVTLCGVVAADGPAAIVLVRRRARSPTDVAVLHLHGFVDYFFQTPLADAVADAGLHFYAVDLRRHGRALRPHQRPNDTVDLDEYLQDVDRALQALRAHEGVASVVLGGHSTGGLVAALYAHRGRSRQLLRGVFLNSPFLDMNLPRWQQHTVEPALAWLGRWAPNWRIPGLTSAYGQSLHADHHGQWRYRTDWKPIAGFAVHAGWFRAIHRAHAEVARGLAIDVPCLVLHAQRSVRQRRWSLAVMHADAVLNVTDIERLAPRLGARVECHALADAIHDVMLSDTAPRLQAQALLRDWLRRVAAPGAATG